MKLAGAKAIVRELTRLTQLERVNEREGLRQLVSANDKVDLQSTEIAVAVAFLLPNSASTLTELDVRYCRSAREGMRLTPFQLNSMEYTRTDNYFFTIA